MWSKDLAWSKWSFQNLIWPELNNYLAGKLDPIEGSDQTRDLDIDRQSGVDYWWVEEGAGRTAISSRVQANDGRKGFPYNTFTIRRSRLTGTKTEYQKLKDARENRRLYPAMTVQGYISEKTNGSLISFALAYTDKILDYIDNGLASINNTSNADFFIIPFGAVAHYQWPPVKLQNNTDIRDSLIRKIAQSHIAPGFSLHKQNLLFAEYGIKTVESWTHLTIEQLKEMYSITQGKNP